MTANDKQFPFLYSIILRF